MDEPAENPPQNQELFRVDGPFFPYVGSILTAMASSLAMIDNDNPLQFNDADMMGIGGVKVERMHLSLLQIYQSANSGFFPQKEYWTHLGVMLSITAYEAIRLRSIQTPTVEYLRHIRNASSHGNRFNLTANEPARPAVWRGHVIDHSLKGDANPLQGKQCFGEYFWIADILQLLWDVEQQITEAKS